MNIDYLKTLLIKQPEGVVKVEEEGQIFKEFRKYFCNLYDLEDKNENNFVKVVSYISSKVFTVWIELIRGSKNFDDLIAAFYGYFDLISYGSYSYIMKYCDKSEFWVAGVLIESIVGNVDAQSIVDKMIIDYESSESFKIKDINNSISDFLLNNISFKDFITINFDGVLNTKINNMFIEKATYIHEKNIY